MEEKKMKVYKVDKSRSIPVRDFRGDFNFVETDNKIFAPKCLSLCHKKPLLVVYIDNTVKYCCVECSKVTLYCVQNCGILRFSGVFENKKSECCNEKVLIYQEVKYIGEDDKYFCMGCDSRLTI